MTKIIPLSDMRAHMHEILQTLRDGGVVLYPTDTIYGLGGIARDKAAAEKINVIKHTSGKMLSIITPDIKTAEKYVHINSEARRIMEQYLPGALTLILPAKDKELAKSRGNEFEIGIRIPDHTEILDLVTMLGEPITTTSANLAGEEPGTNCADIVRALPGIDIAIDAGVLEGKASTIIKFSGSAYEVLRQGSVVLHPQQ